MYLNKYDVVVVGGGPGGFPAAIAAARMGAKVLLVERGAYLGGLLAAGIPPLAFLDRAGNRAVGGIAQELVDRLGQMGASSGHMRVPIQNSMTMLSAPWARIMAMEMCVEAGVHILLYADVLSVAADQNRVTGLDLLCKGEKLHFDAAVIIDATGDGIVLSLAGAACTKEETLQPPTLVFHLGNVDLDRALNYLRGHPQTYQLPATFPGIAQDLSVADKYANWPIMAYFDLIAQAKAKGEFDVPRDMIDFVVNMNPNEVIMNVTRAPGCDTSDYVSATQAEIICNHQIIDIFNFMRRYVPGFERCTLASLAPCVGARESRKVVGRKRLSAAALDNLDIPPDTVALCGYNVDIHGENQSVAAHNAASCNMSVTPVAHAIGIPYGCLVPEKVEGLLASGRLICVDKTIFAMSRIMPTCMACGQAAGVAAAMAAGLDIQPGAVDVQALRRTLTAMGGIVSLQAIEP